MDNSTRKKLIEDILAHPKSKHYKKIREKYKHFIFECDGHLFHLLDNLDVGKETSSELFALQKKVLKSKTRILDGEKWKTMEEWITTSGVNYPGRRKKKDKKEENLENFQKILQGIVDKHYADLKKQYGKNRFYGSIFIDKKFRLHYHRSEETPSDRRQHLKGNVCKTAKFFEDILPALINEDIDPPEEEKETPVSLEDKEEIQKRIEEDPLLKEKYEGLLSDSTYEKIYRWDAADIKRKNDYVASLLEDHYRKKGLLLEISPDV
jgi:hypothetical protein